MCASEHTADDQKAALWTMLRRKMVDKQLINRGIKDARILAAFESVPRHLFVPQQYQSDTYDDTPLPIGHNQTISQPFVVAYMLSLLNLTGKERVLEIGSGSGYQTAILAHLVQALYSIEIIPELLHNARDVLSTQGYQNIHLREGDGSEGWPEAAPFDAIVVSAAPKRIPKNLVEQLGENGRLILPLGRFRQRLMLIVRKNGRLEIKRKISVRFVPLTHR